MNCTRLLAIVFISLAFAPLSNADIFKSKKHFETTGKVDRFEWAPDRYKSDFKYDVFYYIPDKIKDETNAKGLIFTHGGGQSTVTREGSIAAVGLYMPDLKRMADELGIVVVLPSANGLNWGGHTRGLMKDLATLMRTELNIDSNRLGVSGHSMGGMGITRNYLWTADEFAFYLPMSAGMDEKIQSEQQLNKVFNVPYVHLQGRGDHFDIFVTRTEEQLRRTKELETKYGVSSKLDVIFYSGAHGYDFELFKHSLDALYTKSPRDLYQKELWGTLHTVQATNTENNLTYDFNSEPRYFWVELAESDLATSEVTDFHAKIDGNVIKIDMPVVPKLSKQLKIYLHPKMVDLNKEVEVFLNGKSVQTRQPKAAEVKNMDANDPGFEFADVMTIKL